MKRPNILVLASAVALVAFAACKKESATSKPAAAPDAFPRTDTAPLWKLVPANAQVAVVFADGSLAHLHKAGVRFITDFAGAPGGAEVLAEMRQEATELADLMKPDGPKNAGVDLARGALFYAVDEDQAVMVLPIGDRAAFFKIAKGKKKGDLDVFDDDDMFCNDIDGRYVCSKREGDLATFGKADGMSPPAKADQGHVEMMVGGEILSDLPPPMRGITEIRGAATFEPGGVTVRVGTTGALPGMGKPTSGAPRLLADVAKLKPTGVLTIRAKDLWPLARAAIPQDVRSRPGPLGLVPGDLIDALDGEAAGYALGGAPGGVLRIGLKDEAPFKKILDNCDKLLPPQMAKVVKENDRCRLSFTPPAPNSPEITATVWLQDKSLRIGLGDFEGQRDAPAIQPMAVELLEEPWTFAAWGYGGFISPEWKKLMAIPEVTQQLGTKEAKMGIWFFLHLAELGVAVRAEDNGVRAMIRLRTSWSNPDAVLQKLEPLLARVAGGDFGALDDVVALAKQHGSSPLASDIKAGVGAAAPMALFGTLSAVAIPSFMKYIKKSKTSEPRMFVKKMSDGARAFYMDGSGASTSLTPTAPRFPGPSTQPTPPAGSCCQGSDGKCMPDANLWSKEPWVSLQFSVDDPHYYSYQYVAGADGDSFTVRALGDLDCDGVFSTFEMTGRAGPDGPVASPSLYRENELE